jgi:ATP-binding cassette subfamily B protein
MSAGRDVGTWAAGVRVAGRYKRRYVPGGLLWVLNHSLPFVTGLILKAVFDRVSGAQPAYTTALSLLAVLVAAEIGRAAVGWGANAAWPAWYQVVAAWIRGNLLRAVLIAPGPPADRLPASAGEAIGRFRDDVEDVMWFVDIWVDVAGGIVFTVAAVAVMASRNWLVTLVVVVPLIAVIAATRSLSNMLRRNHRRMRERGSSVTDFVADLFAGVLTLKAAGAEDRALARFRERNARRRDAAMRAQLASDMMASVSGASVGISIGLVLLLGAAAMRQGSFTVGDLALFTSYASALTGLPRWLGRMLARQREASVALSRLARFEPDRRVDQVLEIRPVPQESKPGVGMSDGAGAAHSGSPFSSLEIRDLTAHYRHGGADISAVDLTVAAGSLTVITGAVGSGKTTLLRALLGLIPIEAGTIRWNGEEVGDPGTILVPPRVAYAGQIPRLFSATLEENLRLGWPASEVDLLRAVALAQFEGDLGTLPLGFATLIGPRGSRLSGGQSQRAALTRSFLRSPQLLVLDDVSSALDTQTEERLWKALRASEMSILVASHRRAVLRRADQIVVLDRGRAVAAGASEELLRSSAEFGRLWQAEISELT